MVSSSTSSRKFAKAVSHRWRKRRDNSVESTAACPKVDRGMSVQELVDDQLLRTGRRCFFVMEDDRLVGLVTANEVRAVPDDRWPSVTVREVMHPLNKIHVVPADTPEIEALDVMRSENVNQLPVIANGRVEGIVTRATLLEVLRSRTNLNLPRSLARAA